MKNKIIIAFMAMLAFGLLTACADAEEKKEPEVEIETIVVDDEDDEEYTDPEIAISMYNANGNSKTKASTKESFYFTPTEDIASFEVYLSDEDSLNMDQKEAWNKYYDELENKDNYKIGYKLEIALKDGNKLSGIVLKPSDENAYGDNNTSFKNYLELWTYDDINQPDGIGWYSHLLESEYNDNSILSSIKLTCGADSAKIEKITLTAFVYNKNNADKILKTGNIGENTYTVEMFTND